VTGKRGLTATSAAAALGIAALASGCGGGERQDANEPSGTYSVEIVKARFASTQAIAQPQKLAIVVRNADSRKIPNIGVTVDSFSYLAPQANLAERRRPVWIIDSPPRGGEVAQNGTWALGPLAPGESKTFVWGVTAVVPGLHTVRYRVVAGLNGKAKAQLDNGSKPEGTFTVNVSGRPVSAVVDPDTGKVIRYRTPGR
jgi:hypothetical protein